MMEASLKKSSIEKLEEARRLDQDKTLRLAVIKALDVLLLATQALTLAAEGIRK